MNEEWKAEMAVFQTSGFICVSLVRQHNASLSEESVPETYKL